MKNRQSNFMYGYRVTFPNAKGPLLTVSALRPDEFAAADQNKGATVIEALKDGVWINVPLPIDDETA